MARKGKCKSKSKSFVEAAEQVCLQPVLEHRQRRGRRNIAWQAVPHLCLGGAEPCSARYVSVATLNVIRSGTSNVHHAATRL